MVALDPLLEAMDMSRPNVLLRLLCYPGLLHTLELVPRANP